jgi:outer membrane protein OmpA-like peptidoglycan-associated protein
VTVLGEHDRIEADLRQRVGDALRSGGLAWAGSGFAGRDGTLTGRAIEDADPSRAAEIARKVWGVRVLDNRAELVEKVDTYVWSATRADDTLRLTGYVPNEETRKAVLAEVAGNFPKLALVDEMKLARGAPARDVWLGGIGFGLKQLAALRRGAVELNGTNLSVSGEAADFPSYKGIKKSLQKMPQGVKLVSEKVTPPLVDPFVWSAKLAANQLALSGYVPSEKLREDLFAQVKKSFPKIAIVDRMEVADGAPEGWATSVVGALAGLAQLKEGTADISGRSVALAGVAADEAAAETARGVFRKDVPKAFKLSDTITFLKPTLPVAAPFVTTIEARSDAVELTGSVPSDAARAAIVEAIKARLPGRTINDRMQIAAGAPDGWQSCLTAAIAGIGRLGGGSARLSDRQASVSGETTDEALASAVPGEVRASANRACETDVKIALLAEPEPNLTWRAVRGAEGEVVMEGDVPNAAIRADLLRSAGAYFPGASVVDRMTIANAKSQKWGKVADLGLRSLGRLRRGEAVLSRQELLVRGEASDTAVAASIKEQIGRDLARGYTGRDQIDVRSDAALWAEAEAKKKAEAQRIADEAEARRKAEEAAAVKAAPAPPAAAPVPDPRAAAALRCQTLLRSAASEGTIQFERAKADIDRKSLPTLNELAKIANSCPEFQITIDGHTDAEGTDERNQRLSDRRARAVADYLIKAGVAEGRLTTAGYGATQPVAPNDTPQNRAKNRRIEFGVSAK